MAFDRQAWREGLAARLAGWKGRWEKARGAGVSSLYAFLSAMALWPVVEAARGGEWAALMTLGGVAAGVGGNLLANQIQSWKDEASAARALARDAAEQAELRDALDQVMHELQVVAQARERLDDADRSWFAETLRADLVRLGNLDRYTAVLDGPGAVAQGAGATAVGARGVLAEGDVEGSIVTGGEQRLVHAEVYIEHLDLYRDAEREREIQALTHYLHGVRLLCNALPLAALAEEEGPHRRAEITLNRVYIALHTTRQEREEGGDADGEAEAQVAAMRGGGRPLPVLEAAGRERRLAILGDPGSGKSTFVNHLAYLLAGACLELDELPEGWPHGPLLPVRVALRELAAELPTETDLEGLSAERREARLVDAVWGAVRRDLAANYRAEEAAPALERAVDRCMALLVFDGLDEVAPERRAMAHAAVEAFARRCGENRVLVTCRVRSYPEGDRLAGFADVTLAPLTEGQIDDFVARWYGALADLGTLRPAEAGARVENLREAVRPLGELASNPLLLTTMAVVHTAQVELPRERARLYERCVGVLLRRWHQHKTGDPSPLLELGLSESHLLRALWEVAYVSHRQAGAEEGNLPRGEVLRVLAHHLGSYARAERFLDYVDTRAGLLIGQGGSPQEEPTYAFPHRTFQEFMAGCHLALGERDFGRTLRGLLGEGERWALAARLGAEHLLYNANDELGAFDAMYNLCPTTPPVDEAEWRGVVWAGGMAATAGAGRVAADVKAPDGGQAFLGRLVPRLVCVLEEDHLPAVERCEAGNALARLGDPRFCAEAWHLPAGPMLGFLPVPAGPFRMGTPEEDVAGLLERLGGEKDWYADEVPQHEVDLPAFYVARWPVTVAQLAAFSGAGGYREARYWAEAQAAGTWQEGRVRYWGYRIEDGEVKRHEEWAEGPAGGLPNHPAVGVSWYEALAYCRWLTEVLREWPGTPEPLRGLLREGDGGGRRWAIRLPSEAEWEKGARGVDGRAFPWGEEPNPEWANYGDTGIGTTSAVGCFPGGASPYGAEDMAGNVWEWTRSLWGKEVAPEFGYPYDPADGREDESEGADVARVLRGGAFGSSSRYVRCAIRVWGSPCYRVVDFGFRVVASPV